MVNQGFSDSVNSCLPDNGNAHYEHHQFHWLAPYLLKGTGTKKT